GAVFAGADLELSARMGFLSVSDNPACRERSSILDAFSVALLHPPDDTRWFSGRSMAVLFRRSVARGIGATAETAVYQNFYRHPVFGLSHFQRVRSSQISLEWPGLARCTARD